MADAIDSVGADSVAAGAPHTQWPFAVHVVYDSGDAAPSGQPATASVTQAFAAMLCARLSSGERATGVPVRLWRNQTRGQKRRLPERIPLDWSDRNVVIVLVDQVLFERRDEWKSCIGALARERRPGRDIILPFAVQADAAKVVESFRDVNYVAVGKPSELIESETQLQSIYTSILRLLSPVLPEVFLCHAKADGEVIARRLQRYLNERSQLRPFFDRHDIPHGFPVREAITNSIAKSVMLVVWSDDLFDSPWCQFEIIEARRQQRPMLILDALVSQSTRLFPFLGNMPVVRWKRDPATVVSAMLLELVRAAHLEAVFRFRVDKRSAAPEFCLHPPDLVASGLESMRAGASPASADSSSRLWVYPDPPIKADELMVLHQSLPHRRFLSLVEWQALETAGALDVDYDPAVNARPEPLRGLRVGVSLSASDTWADLGLIEEHQIDLSYDIALQLILLGAKVVWGGDLRPEGFGRRLQSIVNTYQHPTRAPQDHVALFVPFKPAAEKPLTADELEARRAFAEVRAMHSPVAGMGEQVVASSAESKALIALALSAMRAELGKDCDARILLGGGLLRFQGLYPGVVEEAYEAVQNDRPLYVLAGFGGAARVVYDSIADLQSPGAAQLLQSSRAFGAAADEAVCRAHESFVAAVKRPEFGFAPENVAQAFAQLGLGGLSQRNGLTTAENALLSTSQDVHEIVGLVVKGLVSTVTA